MYVPLRLLPLIAIVACASPSQETSPVRAAAAIDVEVHAVRPDGTPIEGARVDVLVDSELSGVTGELVSRTTGDYVDTIQALARERGETDASGRASLGTAPSSSGQGATSVLVAVEAGAYFGLVEKPIHGGRAEVEVVATERQGYRVQVLDSAGEPAGGIPVTAAVAEADGGVQLLPVTTWTDPNGEATLFIPAGSFGSRTPLAIARVATLEPLRVELEESGSVTTLHLPAVDELVLDFKLEGVEGYAQVFHAREGSRSDSTLVHRGVDGVVNLGPVERGLPLRAVCLFKERGQTDALGRLEWVVPVGERESNGRIEAPVDDYVVLEGRVVDLEAIPVTGAGVVVRVLGRPRWSWPTHTGEDGRFRWIAPRDVCADGRIRVDVGDLGPTGIVELPEEFEATFELGDLVLVEARS